AGGTIRDLVVKPGSWGEPVVSPDGKLVAFTGYEPSGHTHTTSDLFVVPIAGGAIRKISGDYDRNPNNLVWAPDGSGVYFDAEDRRDVVHLERQHQSPGLDRQAAVVRSGEEVSADP